MRGAQFGARRSGTGRIQQRGSLQSSERSKSNLLRLRVSRQTTAAPKLATVAKPDPPIVKINGDW
jgi:hypothetical protein